MVCLRNLCFPCLNRRCSEKYERFLRAAPCNTYLYMIKHANCSARGREVFRVCQNKPLAPSSKSILC